MDYNFDALIDRRHSDSEKWNHFAADVLPLWVADMDFRSPQPVIDALHAAVEHGIFGYGCDPATLREVFVERLLKHYGWRVDPDSVIFLPGVARGFHLACRVFAAPGDGVLIQPPVYPPILKAHSQAGLVSNEAELACGPDGAYTIDLDVFESAITERTRLFLLCNPHNPVGRAFRRDELEAMARICLKHNVLICSDEIHCDLIYSGHQHTPIASLSSEIADRTMTLMAPSKTFNIPGLKLSVAIITNPDLRKDYLAMQGPLTGGPKRTGCGGGSCRVSRQPGLAQPGHDLPAGEPRLRLRVRAGQPAHAERQQAGSHLSDLDRLPPGRHLWHHPLPVLDRQGKSCPERRRQLWPRRRGVCPPQLRLSPRNADPALEQMRAALELQMKEEDEPGWATRLIC